MKFKMEIENKKVIRGIFEPPDYEPYVYNVVLECGHWVYNYNFKHCAKLGTCPREWCKKPLNDSFKYCIKLYAENYKKRPKNNV
jgi:hypothetical protein